MHIECLKFLELFVMSIQPCRFDVFFKPSVQGLIHLSKSFDEEEVDVEWTKKPTNLRHVLQYLYVSDHGSPFIGNGNELGDHNMTEVVQDVQKALELQRKPSGIQECTNLVDIIYMVVESSQEDQRVLEEVEALLIAYHKVDEFQSKLEFDEALSNSKIMKI